MYSAEVLLDIHERGHRSFKALMAHCHHLTPDEFNRELAGFGYPTVQLQLHHAIAAEKYWLGVLEGRMDVDDDAPDFAAIESLEKYRESVFAATEAYLHAASPTELNTARPMMTWGNKERILVPANVIIRPVTHYFHHQGQVLAMCRLMGKPCSGLDYPII